MVLKVGLLASTPLGNLLESLGHHLTGTESDSSPGTRAGAGLHQALQFGWH
jgi:hypothetical protein